MSGRGRGPNPLRPGDLPHLPGRRRLCRRPDRRPILRLRFDVVVEERGDADVARPALHRVSQREEEAVQRGSQGSHGRGASPSRHGVHGGDTDTSTSTTSNARANTVFFHKTRTYNELVPFFFFFRPLRV